MWQLETDATNASSGSTFAGLEYGTGTSDGEGDAGTVVPPSNVQMCSREYLPFRKSGLVRFQLMVALCSDIGWRLLLDHLDRTCFRVIFDLHPVRRVGDFGDVFFLDKFVQVFGEAAFLHVEKLNGLVERRRVHGFHSALLSL